MANAAATTHADGGLVITRVRAERMGFLFSDDLAALAADARTRLTPVLVRCGGGRFTCAAQDAAHFIAIVTRDGLDHVRDVSLLATRGAPLAVPLPLTGEERGAIAHALRVAAETYDADANRMRTQAARVTGDEAHVRLATRFTAQATEARDLAARLDEAEVPRG